MHIGTNDGENLALGPRSWRSQTKTTQKGKVCVGSLLETGNLQSPSDVDECVAMIGL